jgi:acetyl-CoA carboxylase carboxyl transferase subunit alpha
LDFVAGSRVYSGILLFCKSRKIEKKIKMEDENKTAFERVQLARHPERPYTADLIQAIFRDFAEIHGDRRYADDPALLCGLARLEEFEVAIVGQQKGRDTKQRRLRNFGMPKPEGYRKALRAMKMAEKFGRPVISFIDTPGAYPGIDAEERGQAEAIAFNLREMASLKVPTIVVVLGEGGSGGALAIGVGDRVLMLENAVYSVITPEGCAAILWKDAALAPRAAESLRLTANDLLKFDLIDEVVREDGTNWRIAVESAANEEARFAKTAEYLKAAILGNLRFLDSQSDAERMRNRQEKFRKMGSFNA